MSPLSLHNSRGVLSIVWDDDSEQRLDNRLLRERCRCTECEAARRAARPPAAPTDGRVEQINLIGGYGVQLVLSDGHERGIYPWTYLREMVVQS